MPTIANPCKQKREGILLVDKPAGMMSFRLVSLLRKKLGVQKIGHAGTLDPFATGVMVLLVGRNYTRLSDRFLQQDKEYAARIRLGISTDTYDLDGTVLQKSNTMPSEEEVREAITAFQGTIMQIPPMYSAKKVKGKKLCDLARAGKVIEREPVQITLATELVEYTYPYLDLLIACSKGTYIRSIAQNLGEKLGCGAHLEGLVRTRSGRFSIDQCIDGRQLEDDLFDPTPFLHTGSLLATTQA